MLNTINCKPLCWLLFMVFFCFYNATAQPSVELLQHLGYNVPISPKYPKVNTLSHGTEFTVSTYGEDTNEHWRHFFGMPRMHYTLMFQTMGNKDILGSAVGFNPNFGLTLFGNDRINLQIRGGLGVAFFNKYYSKFGNQTNKVIGSSLNFFALGKINAECKLTNHWRLSFGFSGTHYSNGNTAYPNMGINTPSLFAGLHYDFAAREMRKAYRPGYDEPTLDKKIRLSARLSISGTQKSYDGAYLPVYTAGVFVTKKYGHIGRVGIGFETIHDRSQVYFQKYIGVNQGKEFAPATRYCVFLHHELLVGRFGFPVEVGYYLTNHFAKRSKISTKLGANLYLFKPYFKNRHNLSLGVFIRAYGGEADFTELALTYWF